MNWSHLEWITSVADMPTGATAILRFPVNICDRQSPFWHMDKSSIAYSLDDYAHHGDNGMPNQDGQRVLYEIEDKHFWNAHGQPDQFPLALVITESYRRHFLFASYSNQSEIQTALGQLDNEQGWQIQQPFANDWLDSALPSLLDAHCELQRMHNEPVFERLKENGDNPDIVRPVDFTIDGPIADLEKVAGNLGMHGMESALVEAEDGDPPYLLVKHPSDTRPHSINAIERIILSATLDTSAEYDGWGTSAESSQLIKKVGFLKKLKNIIIG